VHFEKAQSCDLMCCHSNVGRCQTFQWHEHGTCVLCHVLHLAEQYVVISAGCFKLWASRLCASQIVFTDTSSYGRLRAISDFGRTIARHHGHIGGMHMTYFSLGCSLAWTAVRSKRRQFGFCTLGTDRMFRGCVASVSGK
jgi:hypothetical protein